MCARTRYRQSNCWRIICRVLILLLFYSFTFFTFSISSGFSTRVVAPCCNRKSLLRNPHNTLIQGIPELRAVSISTSLSPIYTAPSAVVLSCRRASMTVSGAGFLRMSSRSPIATGTSSFPKKCWHSSCVAA